LAVATGPLEQVLEPIRVRTLETEAPGAAWPVAGELDASRTSQLVQERDVRERSVRVGKRELHGVLVNARPTHVFENTCYAEREIRPKAAEYDEHQTHPADIVVKAHDLGLMNAHIPEEYGGPGLSCFDGTLIGEQLYRGCAGIGTTLVVNGLGAGPVIVAGTD